MSLDPRLFALLMVQSLLTGALAMARHRNELAWALFAAIVPTVGLFVLLVLPTGDSRA